MSHMNYELSYQVNTVNWDGQNITCLPEESYLPALKTLKSLGINEVMLSGYVDHEPAAFDIVEETKRVGDTLQSLGMKAAQHHGLCATYAPLGTSQEVVVNMLKRQVDYVVNLNADVGMFHTGWCTEWKKSSNIQIFEETVKEHGLDALIEVCAKNLRVAGDYAQERGVKIALENCDRFEAMSNIEILPRLIRAVDHPAVGFCLDSGHAHCCCNNLLEWIDTLGDKIFTTHFHDNRGMRGEALLEHEWISPSGTDEFSKIDEHLPPGFGTIPWIDVIQKFREIGYENTINFESGGWPGVSPEKGWEMAINFWRTLEHIALSNK